MESSQHIGKIVLRAARKMTMKFVRCHAPCT
jgi:hypothetical protein